MPVAVTPPWELALGSLAKLSHVDIAISPSTIPNAGLGCILKQAVAKGDLFRSVDMLDCSDEAIQNPNAVIIITRADELEYLVECYALGSQSTKAEIRQRIADFSFADALLGTDKLYICTCSVYMNHHRKPNLYREVSANKYDCRFNKSLRSGDEIVIDYKQYVYPSFYHDWCSRYNIVKSIDRVE